MTDPSSTSPEWDLTTIYPSIASPAFRHDLEALEVLVAVLDLLVASLSAAQPYSMPTDRESAMFERAMTHLNEAMLAAWKLDSYVAAILDTGVTDPHARSIEGHVQQILDHLTAHSRQLAIWTQQFDIDALADRSALARDLAHPLERMVERARRRLPEGEESLTAELRLSCGAVAWSQLRRDVTASMQAQWGSGETERSIPISALQAFTSSPDRAVRRAAYEAECAAWSANSIPLAAALNGIKGEAGLLAVRRGWASPLDEALWQHGLDRTTLDALLTATRKALPEFHRFLRAKARLVGTRTLAWYDLTAPVGTGPSWTFADIQSLVVDAFRDVSPSMGNLADRAFRERWVDASPRPGKPGGGLCYWMGNGISRIRVEFRPGYDGVRMIAHELGHAYHATVLAKARKTALEIESTPFPLWETASKFCEQLVRREVVRQASNSSHELMSVLDGYLTAVHRSIVEALALFHFEDRFFAMRSVRALSPDELNDLMIDARDETSGDALDPDTPFPWTWAALPNMYLVGTTFYNLPYLIAQLLGIGLYAQYEENRSDFRRAFDEALARTGVESLTSFAERFGMDISSSDFWNAGFRIITEDIDRFEALVKHVVAHSADSPALGDQQGTSS